MTHNPPRHKVISNISGLKKTLRTTDQAVLPRLASPLQCLPKNVCSPQTRPSLACWPLLGWFTRRRAQKVSGSIPYYTDNDFEAQRKAMFPRITHGEENAPMFESSLIEYLYPTPRQNWTDMRSNTAKAQKIQTKFSLKEKIPPAQPGQDRHFPDWFLTVKYNSSEIISFPCPTSYKKRHQGFSLWLSRLRNPTQCLWGCWFNPWPLTPSPRTFLCCRCDHKKKKERKGISILRQHGLRMLQLIKLYPEGSAGIRVSICQTRDKMKYCLFQGGGLVAVWGDLKHVKPLRCDVYHSNPSPTWVHTWILHAFLPSKGL